MKKIVALVLCMLSLLADLESAHLLIWGTREMWDRVEGRPWHFYDKYVYLMRQSFVEIYHLEWGDGELINQILAWKFPFA